MASSDRKFLICLILYKPRKPLLHTCPMCTFMPMYLSNQEPRLRTELTGSDRSRAKADIADVHFGELLVGSNDKKCLA